MRKSWLFLLLVGAALLTPLTPVQSAESTGRITFHPRAPTSSTPDAGRGQGQPTIQQNGPARLPQTTSPTNWALSGLGGAVLLAWAYAWSVTRREAAHEEP
jgi:hypothetical protein